MYKVLLLPTARQQLMDAAYYIADELSAPSAADKLMDEVESVVSSLRDMPYRHPVYAASYALRHEIRSVPVRGYILFYVVKEEEQVVEIWRFLHQRQNIHKALRET